MPDQSPTNDPMAAFGPNEWLVDELNQQYLQDKNSVDQAWWEFFQDYRPGEAAINGAAAPAQAAPAKAAGQGASAPATVHRELLLEANSSTGGFPSLRDKPSQKQFRVVRVICGTSPQIDKSLYVPFKCLRRAQGSARVFPHRKPV